MSDKDASTEGALLGGRVRFRQAAEGYRAGMDAALLAAACDVADGARALDIGCGAGAVFLQAAVRRPGASFIGLERDAEALALARENIALNDLESRTEAREGDVDAGFRDSGLTERFDAVLANPPYFDDDRALRGPAPARRDAWLTGEGGLTLWIDFATLAVREGGTITLIHRADRLADLLALLGRRAGSFQIRPIHPFADAPASRIILRAISGGRAPLRLLPPLVLHDRGETKHSAAADAIYRGESELAWLR